VLNILILLLAANFNSILILLLAFYVSFYVSHLDNLTFKLLTSGKKIIRPTTLVEML